MQNVQPIFILPENTQRTTGKTAQSNNIMAAKLVAETVRTTLGPKGMDKMIVDSMGDIIVTNDGVTILQEMHVEHPAAKMVVEIAKTQEAEIGDGTTTAVVIAGELLKQAEKLLEENIHPTIIVKGYRIAAERTLHILDEISEKVDTRNTDVIRAIAQTAMTGKGAETSKDHLSELLVKAVTSIADENGFERHDIKVETKVGESIENSELIKGIVLDKEKIHPNMPSKIENAKIALLNCALEVKNTEHDAKININDPSQFQAFLDQEERMLRDMVEKIKASGANVVITQKGIDDLVQHFLAKSNIYAIRRVRESDLEKLAKSTGGKVVSKIDEITAADLGFAGVVEELKIGDESMTFVKDCKNPKAVTLLIRGSTEHVINEIKRAVEDSIGDIAAVVKNKRIVYGAGACEVELSKRLRHFATSLSGKEQIAVLAFADALEIIPKTLAENSGLDSIDMLTLLKVAHEKGNITAGIDVFNGLVSDSRAKGIIEPLKIKSQAITSASEVATMILRIDDVILGAKGPSQGMPPQGMPGQEMM